MREKEKKKRQKEKTDVICLGDGKHRVSRTHIQSLGEP